MFARTNGSLFRSLKSSFKKSSFVAHCDENLDADSSSIPTLVQQANEALEDKLKIKPPGAYDTVKNTLSAGTVGSFDGFRVIVQKQLNLNTIASHYYLLGSQATGQPIYQYRLILPFDEKTINVSTDAEFNNVEGEVKFPINDFISSKTNFALSADAAQSQFSTELEITDPTSTAQFTLSRGPATDQSLSLSFMQALTPSLTLGGLGTYSFKAQALTTALAGIFNVDEHLIAVQYDNNLRVLYQRKVNPNRIHLYTDLLVDEAGSSQMSVAAEYILKQSKLHMSVDSSLTLKSTLETTLNSNMQLQFSAEIGQLKGHYRFGYGIFMTA